MDIAAGYKEQVVEFFRFPTKKPMESIGYTLRILVVIFADTIEDIVALSEWYVQSIVLEQSFLA